MVCSKSIRNADGIISTERAQLLLCNIPARESGSLGDFAASAANFALDDGGNAGNV